MKSFQEATESMAHAIEEGLLGPTEGDCDDAEGGRQWVHESAWKPLAEINRRGLWTMASQDAKDPITGKRKPWERSYVWGFMPTDEAEIFVSRINLFSPDKIAMIGIIVPDKSPEWTRRRGLRLATNAYYDEELGRWDTRGGAGYDIKRHLVEIKDRLKVHQDFPLSKVEVIDTKWGRPAIAKSGLFNAMLTALDSSVVYTREAYPKWWSGR